MTGVGLLGYVGFVINSVPFHYALNNPVSHNDPARAVTENDIYGYIGHLYGNRHGGSWEKGKGFSFWGADDPMAWYTGAGIMEQYGLYGKIGITDSGEGSQNSFYQNGGRRGSDFLFEGTTTVGDISKPVFVKGKIEEGAWQTDEIIYPDDWGGSGKWPGPGNSLGMLKAQAYFEQNAIHNGLAAAQAQAKAEGLDPYHLMKFTNAAKAEIGFRQMSYGAVAILASPLVIETLAIQAPGTISFISQSISEFGHIGSYVANSVAYDIKLAIGYSKLTWLTSATNLAKVSAILSGLYGGKFLNQSQLYSIFSIGVSISEFFGKQSAGPKPNGPSVGLSTKMGGMIYPGFLENNNQINMDLLNRFNQVANKFEKESWRLLHKKSIENFLYHLHSLTKVRDQQLSEQLISDYIDFLDSLPPLDLDYYYSKYLFYKYIDKIGEIYSLDLGFTFIVSVRAGVVGTVLIVLILTFIGDLGLSIFISLILLLYVAFVGYRWKKRLVYGMFI